MTGIDISGVQAVDVPGAWEFIVVKTTEGNSVVNPKASAQWAAAARTTRGVYHYARPLKSTGAFQAKVFCDDALTRGFKPNVDLWQLDAENYLNEGCSGTTWRVFIDDFMREAKARLGRRGFLYAGYPFLVEHGLLDLPYRYMWWLPDYGSNTSPVDHGVGDIPQAMQSLVVIHQFTSSGGLDQNHISNYAAYQQQPVQPTGGKVQPRFSPALGIVDVLVIPNKGVWGLGDDGGIFTFAGVFHGSAAGQDYFKGRHGARLVVPGTIVPGAAPPKSGYPASAVYEIIATSGERYVPPTT